jgi:prolyl oligopeptidase
VVKQHVFDDFIAAAETLVRERVTSPSHLVASGFSNGGLLVAAATVQRPDLFAAVICDQPLTDMVRFAKYGKDGTPEYGDPDDPDDFAALFAYSPLHHVVAGVHYPPVLVTESEKDDRAHPMHARKFAAALQAATRGGPVLLRVQWNVGHVGSDSRREYAEKIAQEYAFAMRFAR